MKNSWLRVNFKYYYDSGKRRNKMLNILNKVNEPNDLKGLSLDELNQLADEIREVLLKKLSIHGGPFGPNFGMVEAEIAMHYVFS